MRKSAFTLVELLVVIAIIMLLVAMVMPVVQSVRAQAKRVICASNLQQLNMGFSAYATDNRGRLPVLRNWLLPGMTDWLGYVPNNIPQGGTLWPYLLEARIYLCPADSRWRPPPADNPWLKTTAALHSYSVVHSRTGMPLSSLTAEAAFMVDESERSINDGLFVSTFDALASRHILSGWGRMERSNAGCNILFCDGRVEFFRTADVVLATDPMFQ